jgi:Cd2+/Zn2+-exporting ATPase
MTVTNGIPSQLVAESGATGAESTGRISWHTCALAMSVIVFSLGWHWPQIAGSDRQDVGLLIEFSAAMLALFTMCVQWLGDLLADSPESHTDQLVLWALMGAIVTGEYATTVLVPVVLNIGHLLEQRSMRGTHAAIEGIRRLSARTAIVINASGEKEIHADTVRVGDLLLVRPDDVFAADGVVCVGQGAVNEASITGESIPRELRIGDIVHAGTINIDGVLRIEVTRIGPDTTLGRVRQLLQLAMQSKTPFVTLLERCTTYYVPTILFIAGIAYFVSRDLQRVIAVFVVSCPCAFLLAVPSAMIAALAAATRHGILIKNARFLESLAEIDTVVFDKTGTITTGQLSLEKVISATGNPQELFSAAAMCSARSKHPIAQAILRSVERHQTGLIPPTDTIRESSGQGVIVDVNSDRFYLGKPAWLESQGIRVLNTDFHSGPLVGVAKNLEYLGVLLFSDEMRMEAPQVLKTLHSNGINRVVLLTGDRQSAVEILRDKLDFDQVLTDALPEDKLSIVNAEVAAGHRVLVVGDGTNDALALAAGTVGIAFGSQISEVAIHSADIAVMVPDLNRIVQVVNLARRTRRVIWQNITLAAISVVTMLALGASGSLTALTGAILHNAGTVLVLINSARLLRFQTHLQATLPRERVSYNTPRNSDLEQGDGI